MIRALIVDDEPMHIEGLVRHIHWDRLGYDIPLTAESGEDALKILAENRLDVLITDVLMPGMTGIELLAKVKSDYPQLQSLQTIMISGYDEFEFVQDAVHLGAKAYVLKPIRTQELEEKLEAFRITIDKKNQIEWETRALKERVTGSHDVLQERFVQDLIEGRIHSRELLDSWSRLLDLPSGEWKATLFVFGYDRLYPSNPHDAKHRVMLSEGLMKSVKVGLSGFAKTYMGRTGTDEAAAIHLHSSPSDRAKLEKQFSFIQDVLKEQFKDSVTIGISRECHTWEEVPLLYKEVKHMLANARLAGYEQILYFDQLDLTSYRDFRVREEYIPDMVKLLENGDHEKAVLYFHHAFDLMLTQEPISFSYIQAFAMGLISELARKHRRNKESDAEANILMWQRLIDCRSPVEIREAVLDHLDQFSVLKKKEQTAQQHNLIHQIAEYLEANLRDNVTVKQLAERFHLNASYLSVLFKKEMGKTISDFVQEARIQRAKELLRNPGIKVYEAAEQVGFQTSAYFAFLFKKMTGTTPQEYRDYHYEE